MTDLRYRGMGYCDQCEQYTFQGRWDSSVENSKEWEFVCSCCLEEER